MRETKEDLERLQALLDSSIREAGTFIRESLQMLECSLSAAQLTSYLRGVRNVAMATVTRKGESRVAPIGALFFRGHFHVPTVATAARTRHLTKRPGVSITHYKGNDLAIIAHGKATIVTPDQHDFELLERIFQESAGQSVKDWGEGVYLRVETEKLFTFARYAERFP